MGAIEPEVRDNARVRALATALRACVGDPDLTLRFLRDLVSYQELLAFANRWAIARALLAGEKQGQVARRLGINSKTVGNVAQWTRGPYAIGGFAEVDRVLRSERAAGTLPDVSTGA